MGLYFVICANSPSVGRSYKTGVINSKNVKNIDSALPTSLKTEFRRDNMNPNPSIKSIIGIKESGIKKIPRVGVYP